jgi:shikimate 5-dehydrogenase
MSVYSPATRPTLHFIGVTTGQSSIMKVFPEWANYLGLRECRVEGMDFKIHDAPERYREAVAFIKSDPLSYGALITTHKIDLLRACRDQFDVLDDFATLMSEVSSISKRDGKLVGRATDPITSGLALESFLPRNYWAETGAELFVLGAGGSAIAITWYVMDAKHGANRPVRIHVANRSPARLEEMKRIHARANCGFPVEYHHTPALEDSDRIMEGIAPGSMVINATGLGKDAPGSPVTGAARFPEGGIAWDFNYRGDLLFLEQARAQQRSRRLRIEDGWIYFIHGWTHIIAEVFNIVIPEKGPVFGELSAIAGRLRGGKV